MVVAGVDDEAGKVVHHHVTSHDQRGGITAHTVNINPAAPRDETKFYQNGVAVATAGGFGQVFPDGRIVFGEIYNSGEMDFSKPVEFRHLIIQITKADKTKGTGMGYRNGGMVNNITPDIEGVIVGER
jgi:hypothetical protein